MRTITLEEHFASPNFLEGPGLEIEDNPRRFGNVIPSKLYDIGEGRIAEMDAAGIDLQVLSLNYPGVQQLEAASAIETARKTNDYLADAIRHHPRRFSGFATLPTADPDVAANELERMVKEHKFVGGLVNGHSQGRYLDNKFFQPILERAAALKVPIYIHPTMPPKPVIEAYYEGFSPDVTTVLSGAGWGWHIETAVHVLRMIAGGVFDQFPDLQIIIGHMGEALPSCCPGSIKYCLKS